MLAYRRNKNLSDMIGSNNILDNKATQNKFSKKINFRQLTDSSVNTWIALIHLRK